MADLKAVIRAEMVDRARREKELVDAGTTLFMALFRLASRNTVGGIPRYVKAALDRWTRATGIEAPEAPVIEGRPSVEEENSWLPEPPEEWGRAAGE